MKSKKMDRIIHKSGFIRKDLLLLGPFVKEPWREFTLSEVKGITRTSSHHYAYNAMEKFISYGLLGKTARGNTSIYSLNHRNPRNTHYLALVEHLFKEGSLDLPHDNISRMMEKIRSPFYSLIICGSYAEGKQKPDSDLDIAIIIPDNDNRKPYEIVLKDGELMIPEIHGFIFTEEELFLMLTNREFNYGKELARKHIIIYGAEAYYKILFRAMENGFNG